jgi:hypothetical protein
VGSYRDQAAKMDGPGNTISGYLVLILTFLIRQEAVSWMDYHMKTALTI